MIYSENNCLISVDPSTITNIVPAINKEDNNTVEEGIETTDIKMSHH
ncbi:hypothetical protein [Jeotgalibaca sp. PTS2502]|nr:hypothetical protein [Jeotgalibaca sp. PTS2502]